MRLSTTIRIAAAAAVLAAAAVIAASWGGSSKADPVPLAGPEVSLYVVDHAGAQPDAAQLAPYVETFQKVLAGCRMSAGDLASVVFQISDQASMGSGVEIGNLAVLRGIAREVGATPVDCNDAFLRAEARLEGAAFGLGLRDLDALGHDARRVRRRSRRCRGRPRPLRPRRACRARRRRSARGSTRA